jgi:hypothetical protein
MKMKVLYDDIPCSSKNNRGQDFILTVEILSEQGYPIVRTMGFLIWEFPNDITVATLKRVCSRLGVKKYELPFEE